MGEYEHESKLVSKEISIVWYLVKNEHFVYRRSSENGKHKVGGEAKLLYGILL